MKIHIVYFAYLKPNQWEDIVLEQLWDLKSSPLYELADSINISVCSDDVALKRLKQHIWAKFKKVGIINWQTNNSYEYPGIKAIYDLSKNEVQMDIYFVQTCSISVLLYGNDDERKPIHKQEISATGLQSINVKTPKLKKNESYQIQFEYYQDNKTGVLTTGFRANYK